MNYPTVNDLCEIHHATLAGSAMLEPLENRCLLSVSVAPPSLSAAAQPESALVQPAKLHKKASTSTTVIGTYAGTLHLARLPKGFTGTSNSHNAAFTLVVTSQTPDGAASGTFSVPGLADYNFSGTMNGRSLIASLSGPGSGTLKITFTARTLVIHGNFTSMVNGKKFTGSLSGGASTLTPPTPGLLFAAPAPVGAGGSASPRTGITGGASTAPAPGTGSTGTTDTTTTTVSTTNTTTTTTNTTSGIDTGTTTDQSGIGTGTTVNQSGIDTGTTVDGSGIGTASGGSSTTTGTTVTTTGSTTSNTGSTLTTIGAGSTAGSAPIVTATGSLGGATVTSANGTMVM